MRFVLISLLALSLASGCDSEKGSRERRTIVREDQASVIRAFRKDLNDGMTGVRRAADIMKRGFLVEDHAQREREMRAVMRRLQSPTNRDAIDELMFSPISFLAAVDTDGTVIARDAEPDLMHGLDIAEVAPVVQRALEGEAGYALESLPSLLESDPPSVTIIFAAPARYEGRVVGAMVAGLPLWRLSQQLSNQLQHENADAIQQGAHVWALPYQGEVLHYHNGFPPDLRELAPDQAARREGLTASPGGYTGEVYQYGRWYGYGVLPLPRLGEDVGVIMFRSDPV